MVSGHFFFVGAKGSIFVKMFNDITAGQVRLLPNVNGTQPLIFLRGTKDCCTSSAELSASIDAVNVP